MRKILLWRRFRAYTAYTAVTFVATLWQHFFSKSGNTVATPMIRRIKAVFPSKSSLFSLFCGSSGNTFPNFAQENHDLREGNDISPVEPDFPDSWELGDEYDLSDYGDWLEEEGCEDFDGEFGDCDEEVDWWDAVEDGENRKSWCAEAVDEAIDDEQPGQYPPGDPSDVNWLPF